MAVNPEIRASDSDRDRVAAGLREHCAQGRLTIEELNERLEQIYAAKTLGDLQRVTADLPEEDLYELPVPARKRAQMMEPRSRHGRGVAVYRRSMQWSWATWAAVSTLNFFIWLIVVVGTANWVYPWWVWVAGPWGAVLLTTTLFGPRPRK
jgi:hypothetical protein